MVNKVTLLGRLGKDPEVRHFENDGAVCNFTMATNRSYKTKAGEKVEETEWHNLVIWSRGLVGVAEKYLKKGDLLFVEGRLATRSWDDQSGVKKYTTEIIVETFKMLGGKNEGGGNYPPAPSAADAPKDAQKESTAVETDDVDDLPF
ncbi:MAG: single-stranded DNA-binding protein [Chitinophagales bacterium]